ncbi:MAG: hypothetical protein ABSD48_08145 [Armatimonadota bacterium]|jgi:hypothetical protein
MRLDEWANQHRDDLVAQPTRVGLIADLRAVADREMRDAETVASDDGRLGHAHAACIAIAAAALAVRGYRVRQHSSAHHWQLIESLHYTLDLSSSEVRELQEFRRKRSRSVYERAGIVTRTEADAARRLRDRFRAWLSSECPDLVG